MPQHWFTQHPSPGPGPAERHRPIRFRIEPPGRLSSTRRWRQFRDELARLLPIHPTDQNLPLYVAAADTVLTWRAIVPAEDRFWAEDRD